MMAVDSDWRHLRARGGSVALEGAGKQRDRRERYRLFAAMLAFALAYGVVALRLVSIALEGQPDAAGAPPAHGIAATRPDLIDRTGEILATDLKTASLYAEPRRIIDAEQAYTQLIEVLPELTGERTRRRLATDAGFVWLKREITPSQQRAIHRLGIPGVGFLTENRRFYPGGPLASHVLGHVNVDNEGIAGFERHVDRMGLAALHRSGFATDRSQEPVRLSLDIRVQHALRDELAGAIERYRAIAAVGVVLDVRTGEILGLSSLPDYDPNEPQQALDARRLNRATVGLFEMGSVFKLFTTAMALDSGQVGLDDAFDASLPLTIDGFKIRDFHAKNRSLTVPEIFVFSSNIGAAKMALKLGAEHQQRFLGELGLLEPLATELPETAKPTQPADWSDLSTATISFGHGLAVSPLQLAGAAAAMVNGGYYMSPTFLPRSPIAAHAVARPVISAGTSDMVRKLMRENVVRGSGRRADVAGYRVGGKTGTAEKVVDGRYADDKRLNSFLAAFPMDNPRYVVLILVDEPKPEQGQSGATAGMNAAPTAGRVIRRIAPALSVEPHLVADERPLFVSYQ